MKGRLKLNYLQMTGHKTLLHNLVIHKNDLAAMAHNTRDERGYKYN